MTTPIAIRALRRVSRVRLRLGAALVAAGLVAGTLGAIVGIAAENPASASGLHVCGAWRPLAPGDSGACAVTIRDKSAPKYTGLVNVTVVIRSHSHSGGGSPTAVPPVGTEALLDGTPTGLQVESITDTNTGQTFELGSISCFAEPSGGAPASYPTAAYCRSFSPSSTVASSVDNATFSNTFVIKWRFPLLAGNPYQGGGATISISPTFIGYTGPTPTPTVRPTPTPSCKPIPTPTWKPTNSPSGKPSASSSWSPTSSPTGRPTPTLSEHPTPSPTGRHIPKPTCKPGPTPTWSPTPSPSWRPTPSPTKWVTPSPTGTATPTPSPTGGSLGAGTTSPSPSASPGEHGGVLAASDPTTGAQLPILLSQILILTGIGLILVGFWVWRRQRYFGET